MALGICRLPIGMNRNSGDPDAVAWASAVTGAGGTYSAGTLAAVSAFCVSAKASGYWTKLNRINLFCGNQLAAALVPLKVGGGSATDTNVNFVGGDYAEATGVTGSGGASKSLATGLVPSVSLTANDTHIAVYNRSSSAALGAGRTIGCVDGAANTFDLLAPFNDGMAYSEQYDQSGAAGRVVSGVIGTPFGFVVGSRTAANSHSVYRNGASLASTATSGGVLPAFSVSVFGQNNAGVVGAWVSYVLAGYSIGSGLTAGDVTAYATHMQTFQTALGRNV